MADNLMQNLNQSVISESESPDIFDEMDKIDDKKPSKIEIPSELEKVKGLDRLTDFIERYKKIDIEVVRLTREEETLGKKIHIPDDERLAITEDEAAYRPGVPDLVRMRVLKQAEEESKNRKLKLSEKKLAYDIVVLNLAGAQERAEAFVEDAKKLVEKILISFSDNGSQAERQKIELLNNYITESSKPTEIGHKLGNICAQRLATLHKDKLKRDEELSKLMEAKKPELPKEETKAPKVIPPFHASLDKNMLDDADIKIPENDNFEINSIETDANLSSDNTVQAGGQKDSSTLVGMTNNDVVGMTQLRQGFAGQAAESGQMEGMEKVEDKVVEAPKVTAEVASDTPETLVQPIEKEVEAALPVAEIETPSEINLSKETVKSSKIEPIEEAASVNKLEDSPKIVQEEPKDIQKTSKKQEKKKVSNTMSILYEGIKGALDKGNPEKLSDYIKALDNAKKDAMNSEISKN